MLKKKPVQCVCACAYGRKRKVIFKKEEEDKEDELILALF
jgi:hypothetical protein